MRIVKPKIVIDGADFECKFQSVTLEPGDPISYCEREWTFSGTALLDYGTASGLWNKLNSLRDTKVTFLIYPDASKPVSDQNPSATFEAMVPAVSFMNDATQGEHQTVDLEFPTEEPVFAEAPAP